MRYEVFVMHFIQLFLLLVIVMVVLIVQVFQSSKQFMFAD